MSHVCIVVLKIQITLWEKKRGIHMMERLINDAQVLCAVFFRDSNIYLYCSSGMKHFVLEYQPGAYTV